MADFALPPGVVLSTSDTYELGLSVGLVMSIIIGLLGTSIPVSTMAQSLPRTMLLIDEDTPVVLSFLSARAALRQAS
jgi:hypothetical protein